MRFIVSEDELDESFATARAVAQPFIQVVYLGTAFIASARGAWRRVAGKRGR